MDIAIRINDDFIRRMFDIHCDKNECGNCCCIVLPSENYASCYSKYIDVLLNNDVQEYFSEIIEFVTR